MGGMINWGDSKCPDQVILSDVVGGELISIIMWETIFENDHHSQVGGAVEFLRVGRRHKQWLGWRSLFEVFLWYLEFCELSTRKRAKNMETSWRVVTISRHQAIKLLSSRIGFNHQSSRSLWIQCELRDRGRGEHRSHNNRAGHYGAWEVHMTRSQMFNGGPIFSGSRVL